MRNDRLPFMNKIVRVRSISAAVLAMGCAFGTITHANAQRVAPPPTPASITPDPGNVAFLVGHAVGSQGYTCLPTNTGGPSWTVNPARPEATLFTEAFGLPFQIITHFVSMMKIPTITSQNPYPWEATLLGRVPSTVAECGLKRWGHRSRPAQIARVARTPEPYPASCCNQLGTIRARRAGGSWIR
jgi:hypothetical protein